jgi:hypothetical protein
MGGEAFVKVGVKDGHLRRRRDEVLKGQEAAAARQRGDITTNGRGGVCRQEVVDR